MITNRKYTNLGHAVINMHELEIAYLAMQLQS